MQGQGEPIDVEKYLSLGGGFNGVKRQDEFLECRSLLTLDIDKYECDIGGLEFDLYLS